jgi:hypothetical protein
VSEELSIDAVIRGAMVEFWARKPELQSRAHTNTQRGNAFIERIVFFRTLPLEESLKQMKSCASDPPVRQKFPPVADRPSAWLMKTTEY